MTNEEYRQKLSELEMKLILEKDLNKIKEIKSNIKEINDSRKTTLLEEGGKTK